MKRKSPIAGICSALLLFTVGSVTPAQADTIKIGAHDALCKPFDNEELLATARELLGEAKAPARAMRPPESSG